MYKFTSINMLNLFFIANSILWPFNFQISGFHIRLNLVASLLCSLYLLSRSCKFRFFFIRYLLLSMGLFSFFYLFAKAGPCENSFTKFYVTAPIFILNCITCYWIGFRSTLKEWLGLKKSAIFILCVAFVIILAEYFVPELFPLTFDYRVAGLYSGLFPEPSALAFSITPSLFVLLTSPHKTKFVGGFFLVIFSLFSMSATYLGCAFVYFFYEAFTRKKYGLLLITTAALLSLVFFIPDLAKYYFDRIAGIFYPDSTTNLSSLTYMQGWQQAWRYFIDSNLLGIGFNMMGCYQITSIKASQIINSLYPSLIGINSEDGTTIASKIISEFGVFGILFLSYLIISLSRLMFFVRSFKLYFKNHHFFVITPILFILISLLFIRSSGYFTGTFSILIILIGALRNKEIDR